MSKQHSIQITSIDCLGTSGDKGTSSDELYLVCQSDAGIAVRVPAGFNTSNPMQAGDSWEPDNLILGFDYEVLVTLWDHDVPFDPKSANYLQSADFLPGSGSGYRTLTNLDGASYVLNYTYID